MAYPRWSWRFPPKSVLFAQQVPSRSGGQSTDGYEQVVVSSAGRWMATVVVHISPQRGGAGLGVIYFRALLAYLQGRSNVFIMPVFDDGQSPGALAGTPVYTPITHSDGSTFSDGSAYAQARAPAVMAAAAAPGAVAVSVTMQGGQAPQPGQYFSVNDRLFLIAAAALSSGATWALTVWPPVREPISAGDCAQFDFPACKMRLAKDDTAALTLAPGYRGDVTLDLVEAPC